jgi:hypothetical protein
MRIVGISLAILSLLEIIADSRRAAYDERLR